MGNPQQFCVRACSRAVPPLTVSRLLWLDGWFHVIFFCLRILNSLISRIHANSLLNVHLSVSNTGSRTLWCKMCFYHRISHTGESLYLRKGFTTFLLPAVSIFYFSSLKWSTLSLNCSASFLLHLQPVSDSRRIKHSQTSVNFFLRSSSLSEFCGDVFITDFFPFAFEIKKRVISFVDNP